jgi:predicted N-acetyltransferase YhbS
MIEIKNYEDKYAKEMSDIILSNLYTINIKDHGKEVIDSIARHFTEDEINKNFPNRTKCLVALIDGKVVGTASLDNFRGNIVPNRYMIKTVFVNIKNQKQGIGKALMNAIEEYAKTIGTNDIIILSSIYALNFYKNLGYDFKDGSDVLNDEKEYTLIKKIEIK